MINKECFTARWIEEKSKELNYPDKNIIEKGHPCLFIAGHVGGFRLPISFQRWKQSDASFKRTKTQAVYRY